MDLFRKKKIMMPCNYCNELMDENRPKTRYPLHAPGKAVVFCQYLNRTMKFGSDFFGICPPIVSQREGQKLVKYCKYCGEEVEKSHSEECPFFYGIKTGPGGYIAFGFKATGNPVEDLQTARMGILLTMRKEGVGPKDKKVEGRLAYEYLRFTALRLKDDKKEKKQFKVLVEAYRHKGSLTPKQEKELLSGKLEAIDFLR